MESQVCNNSARLSAIIKSHMLWDFSNPWDIYIKYKRGKRQWDRCHRFYFFTWGNEDEIIILCDLNVSKSLSLDLIMMKGSLLYQLFHYLFPPHFPTYFLLNQWKIMVYQRRNRMIVETYSFNNSLVSKKGAKIFAFS